MGKFIAQSVSKDETMKIVAGVDLNTAGDTDFPVYQSFENLPDADVIIDFSNPAVLENMLKFSVDRGIPTVIATTGLSDEQIEKIKTAANNIPLFFSFNMSLGINLLVSLSKIAAEVLSEDFDIEIIEKHHNQKIDAPSGTAIMIADAVNRVRDDSLIYEFDRHAKRSKRSKNEIGIHSLRGGTIVGEHEIIFAGKDEVVSIKHEAFSRGVFANGAISAAKFLVGQKSGLYDMNDLIRK